MNVLIIFLLFFNVLFSNAKASSLKGKAIICEIEDEEQDIFSTWDYIFKDDRQDHIIPNAIKGNFTNSEVNLDEKANEVEKVKCMDGTCEYYLADENYVDLHFKIVENYVERISRKGLRFFYNETGIYKNPKWVEFGTITCKVVSPKEAKKILNQKEKKYKSIAEKRKKKNI